MDTGHSPDDFGGEGLALFDGVDDHVFGSVVARERDRAEHEEEDEGGKAIESPLDGGDLEDGVGEHHGDRFGDHDAEEKHGEHHGAGEDEGVRGDAAVDGSGTQVDAEGGGHAADDLGAGLGGRGDDESTWEDDA